MAGSTGYDVIDIASTNLPRFIPGGAFEKLDKSKLPNIVNLDPEIMHRAEKRRERDVQMAIAANK